MVEKNQNFQSNNFGFFQLISRYLPVCNLQLWNNIIKLEIKFLFNYQIAVLITFNKPITDDFAV